MSPFRLGEWRVDPADGTLTSGDVHRRLEPQTMDLLVCLAEQAGRPVSKARLFERVWQGRLVSDDALTSAVAQLRRALGDDARQPRYVETLAKRGYRLCVPAEPLSLPPHGRSRTRFAWVGLGGALLATMAVLLVLRVGPWQRARLTRPVRSLAVLPLKDASVSPDGHLADAVRDPSRQPGTRPEVPAAAMDAYLKGRALLEQHAAGSLRQAKVYFEAAVAAAPRFPEAQAGLADAYTLMADAGLGSPAELYVEARGAARAALEIDPELPEARTALATILFLHDWDLPGAEREFRDALQRQPDSVAAHRRYAFLLSVLARHPEAVAEARRALEIDPRSLSAYRDLADVLVTARRYPEAVSEIRRGLELDPAYAEGWMKLAAAYALLGQEADAYTSYRTALQASGVNAEALERLDRTYSREGIRGVYRALARRLEETPRASATGGSDLALLYAALGERDRAFERLDRAAARHDANLLWLPVAPQLDPLRSDPRFDRLLARLGLTPRPVLSASPAG